MNPVTQRLGPCPCLDEAEPTCAGCSAIGTKLHAKTGHLIDCNGLACRGRANQKAGRKAEKSRHRDLGGKGPGLSDDLADAYSINVQVEDKTGAQIPSEFADFTSSKRFEDWTRAAELRIPIGSGAFPAVMLEIGPAERYLVVSLRGKALR